MADILVVDDDEAVAKALNRFVTSDGHTCRVASSATEGLRAIAEQRPDLVMMDIRMPGIDGLQALERIRTEHHGVCVVIMTGYGTSQTSIDAIRGGAFDYITKPPSLDELRAIIRRALAATAAQGATVETVDPGADPRVGLVGETPAMLAIYKMIGRLARNDVPALIRGERGTGKSLVIATLHANQSTEGGPLIVVDCAAPAATVESEIFGAAKGTLHLAGVEALPADLQPRLARALRSEPGRITSAYRLRARVLASTTRDLAEDAAAGRFSHELYDTLSVIELRLPPLRERLADLPLLIRHFINHLNVQLNRAIRGVDDAAARRLLEYPWPGNVAELERVLTRAAIVAHSDVITDEDIGVLAAETSAPQDTFRALARLARQALQERLVEGGKPGASPYHDLIDIVETSLVKEALTITKGNQVKAADLLGVNRATLRKKAEQPDPTG